MSVFRLIPSTDAVLQRPALAEAAARDGHDVVTHALRRATDELRAILATSSDGPRRAGTPDSAADAAAWLEARALAALADRTRPSLRPVINATGVIIHTNLGRAPLAAPALEAATRVGAGFSNLEYDLAAGHRGHRHLHAARLLCELTGAEAAAVTNNNAAATLLVLAALASGREVIVSRGELVEIGGGFRIPDVMVQSGATLREVGTTNRTRTSDYAAAISERTGAILRVHPSNFRIEGFTERAPLTDLAALGRRFSVPVFEDLGSGWLGLPDVDTPTALHGEPSVAASLAAGIDLVAFSGDKLLGGPQAGIVLGRCDLIERARQHPLMRAVRADKLTYAALEGTLALWAQPSRRAEIPVWRMLTLAVEAIDRRARAVAERLSAIDGVEASVVDGVSTTGGGSAPASALPTRLVQVSSAGVGAAELDRRLRADDPPVVARIERDRLVMDLRTTAPDEDAAIVAALERALGGSELVRGDRD
jgi:L-seryl-tRNA(Ser) seleniumtransferase